MSRCRAGAAFQTLDVSRGAAFGDVDNDGDVDVLVANNNGKARLLINEIGARITGSGCAWSARQGGTCWARASPSSGMMARRCGAGLAPTAVMRRPTIRRVLVGLGQSSKPPRVRVIWPGGATEEWASVPVDRYTTLTEGSGK